MKTPEEHLNEHCNWEYHKQTGERIVHSSESAVVIAMQKYAKEHACKFLAWYEGDDINAETNEELYDEWIKTGNN